VRNTESHLRDFQRMLTDQLGFVLEWPEHLRIRNRAKVDPLGI
jgi:hypothetical protein